MWRGFTKQQVSQRAAEEPGLQPMTALWPLVNIANHPTNPSPHHPATPPPYLPRNATCRAPPHQPTHHPTISSFQPPLVRRPVLQQRARSGQRAADADSRGLIRAPLPHDLVAVVNSDPAGGRCGVRVETGGQGQCGDVLFWRGRRVGGRLPRWYARDRTARFTIQAHHCSGPAYNYNHNYNHNYNINHYYNYNYGYTQNIVPAPWWCYLHRFSITITALPAHFHDLSPSPTVHHPPIHLSPQLRGHVGGADCVLLSQQRIRHLHAYTRAVPWR